MTFDTLGRALAVPGVFLCLHLIEGQIVQPLTVGRRFEVNALVLLLAVWFGYGFWGIPGMLLAMPVVVALKVARSRDSAPSSTWLCASYSMRATAQLRIESPRNSRRSL